MEKPPHPFHLDYCLQVFHNLTSVMKVPQYSKIWVFQHCKSYRLVSHCHIGQSLLIYLFFLNIYLLFVFRGAESNVSVAIDDTFGDNPESYPAHSSTPNPFKLDVSGDRGPLSSTPHISLAANSAMARVNTTPKRRKASGHQSVMSQSPSASHPTGWCISGVETVTFNIPRRKKTTGTQTEVSTNDASTQCLINTTGNEYVEGSTQTSVVMFDNADHFASFGDNLSTVKCLLGEVMEWRGKLINAEIKINALLAEVASCKGKIDASAQHIAKLNENQKAFTDKLKESDGKHSTLLLREKELSDLLKEEKGRLLYRSISTIDARVAHFTGLPNAQVFDFLCSHFTMPLQYHYNWNVTALSREDQLFLTLMKLKCNFDYIDLAVWFNVGKTTVANVFLTLLDALHQVIFLEALKTVPSRAKNRRSLPQCFKGFEDCRMIIDCTEVRTAKPKSLAMKNIMYSGYKGYESLKGLVGIAPNGAMTFASTLYPGSTSDKQVVEMCGILRIFEPGDLVLADKGFTIRDLLRPLGVDLNIPPFLETPQFTPDQVERTKVIARARIHVERAIQRIKEYRILDYVPINLWDISSKIFQVCAALTNFHNPLIKEVEDKMNSVAIDWDNFEHDFDAVWWQ